MKVPHATQRFLALQSGEHVKGKRKVKNMSPQQRAAAMISVRKQHGNRTPRAIAMDARQTARRTFDEDSDKLPLWKRQPGRYDVRGVDTKATATPAKAKVPEPPSASDSWKMPPEQFVNAYVASKAGRKRRGESDSEFKLRKMNAAHYAVKTHAAAVADAVDHGEKVPEKVLDKYPFARRLARPTKTADTAALERNVVLLQRELKERKASTDDMIAYDNVLRATQKELETRKTKKPEPKRSSTKKQDSVKIITNNMPDGYEIHKWSYDDRAGKVTVHAVIFEGKPVFDQNKTFPTLPEARKAVKEHADTQRLLKQVREERAQLEEKGYIGKPLKKTRKTKKGSDVIGERPTGIVRNHLHKLWGQVHGDEQIGDFDTWLSEQSDKTYPEAKADLLKRGARRHTEMTPQARKQ